MSQKTWETVMGMNGYFGSPAQAEDRKEGIHAGGFCEWAALGPHETEYPLAYILDIRLDADGDPEFLLEFPNDPAEKQQWASRSEIKPHKPPASP